MNPLDLAATAKDAAAKLGFDACGITDAAPSEGAARLDDWLARGYHGEMRYMARQAATRRDPRNAWKAAKSIVVVLHNYYIAKREPDSGYLVSRYAQNADYHDVTKKKLDSLGLEIGTAAGGGAFRSYVDAGPLPERDLARRAGLGWIAKNTMLIRPELGSFTFIGCLLTDLVIAPDDPFEADRCGTCTRCLDACPTAAFPEPRVLDATKCISYLTIEAKSDVPPPLRRLVADNLFGCDICQDVCPWNVSFSRETREDAFRPAAGTWWPRLEEILAMNERAFDDRFGSTAIERAGLAGLQRNARVVRENVSR